MNFQLPNTPLSYQQPNFVVTEAEKNANDYEWWLENNRYITSKYNIPPIIWNDNDVNENLSLVDKGFRMSQYYIGKQTNYTYAYVENEAGWVKCKLVNSLVDRIAGQFIDILFSKQISAKALSKRARTAKERKWQDIMMKYDGKNQWLLDKLAEMGIEYQPATPQAFKDKEDAERWLTYSFKDSLELYAADLGKGIEWMNDSDTMYIQGLINDFCPANYISIYNYAENGKIKQKRIPFYNAIFDAASDDPFIRDGKYCGIIERLTPERIFKRFPNLNGTQREEIRELSKNESYYNNYTQYYNTPTLNCCLKRNTDLLVTVTTTWWIAPRDLQKKVTEDKYKNKKIVNVEDGAKDSEFSINDLHKATVVGNKYLLDWGYESNVVRSVEKKADPELPLWVFNANTTMGDGISIIGKVAPLIDDIDLYRKKLTETVARSKGKCYVFVGSALDKNTREMITDFSVMGITTIIGTSGEPNDPNNQKRIVEGVDMTLDPNITAYISLRADLQREIEELLSMPKIAQGMQQSTIGLGVQKGTVAAASVGMTYLWYNLLKLNALAMNHAVNMARIIIAGGKHSMEYIIGERGEKMMQTIKDTMFEDCLIDLTIRDGISEQQRTQLLSVAQALAQNGGIGMLDFIDMLQAETLTELREDIEYSVQKREKQAMEQQKMQMQQQQAMQSQQIQADLQKQQMAQVGQDGRIEATNKANLTKEVLRNESKKELAEQKTA